MFDENFAKSFPNFFSQIFAFFASEQNEKSKILAEISFFKKNAKFSQYNFPFLLETIVVKPLGPIFNLDTL